MICDRWITVPAPILNGPRVGLGAANLLDRFSSGRGFGGHLVESHDSTARPSISSNHGLPLDAIRRPRDTPICKLEAALKCRSCWKGRYAPPVHMINLTAMREITPYKWVHPEEER
jgi:hypothetical protein